MEWNLIHPDWQYVDHFVHPTKLKNESKRWQGISNHPDAEQYERIPLLCYKADQRITCGDLWDRMKKQDALIASELEMRLTGKII